PDLFGDPPNRRILTPPIGCLRTSGTMRRVRRIPVKHALAQAPAPALFVISGISLYLGAALAVFLFDVVSPAGVAWLRCLGASIVLLVWRRPCRAAWRGKALLLAGTFGPVTAGMNVVFYEAIARLPLGTGVAVEFAGPVAVAALGSRRLRDVGALGLVAVCVVVGDDCEIGANTTIDRGALGDTVLEEDVRLDNQIQVGHNVRIGAHTAMAGCSAVAGSAVIGRHCLVGGGAGILGHLEVCDRVVVTAMSLVTHSIREPG